MYIGTAMLPKVNRKPSSFYLPFTTSTQVTFFFSPSDVLSLGLFIFSRKIPISPFPTGDLLIEFECIPMQDAGFREGGECQFKIIGGSEKRVSIVVCSLSKPVPKFTAHMT